MDPQQAHPSDLPTTPSDPSYSGTNVDLYPPCLASAVYPPHSGRSQDIRHHVVRKCEDAFELSPHLDV